jgi:hypothetical protein
MVIKAEPGNYLYVAQYSNGKRVSDAITEKCVIRDRSVMLESSGGGVDFVYIGDVQIVQVSEEFVKSNYPWCLPDYDGWFAFGGYACYWFINGVVW